MIVWCLIGLAGLIDGVPVVFELPTCFNLNPERYLYWPWKIICKAKVPVKISCFVGWWNLVLEESQIPTQLVVVDVKCDNRESEASVDQVGRITITVLVPKDSPRNRRSLRWMDSDRGGKTEEETELRNHLKWARLKVKGDEISVPKVVELKHDGKIFRIQVWIEAPARVLTEGPRENLIFVQRFIEKPYNKRRGGGLVYTEVTGHVGSSESQGNLNYTAVQNLRIHT
ncbi:hypothetical protein MTR67_039408 [Solanum verrucosum]|uniref:Uncharacterized protein n=1 Tax=Solanum verrucosum TaxID=315347 RepID=A0AAF0ZQD1_SOLVR|nr:hypothetical protein MTR67_039408 [Solanum verrucosum]